MSNRKPTEKPENYELMPRLAETLAEGLPHVRVDLYNIAGKPFFGEMTFYTGGGFDPFYADEEQPDGLDCELGSKMELPKTTTTGAC